MLKTKLKIPILIGLITVVLLLAGLLLWALLPKKQADPHALLSKAERLSEQNLCLLAILEQQPEDEESWRQLLTNYAILDADPLTLSATLKASGLALSLPKDVTPQKEEPGVTVGVGGMVQQGKRCDQLRAEELAFDGETYYLAREDGLYALYHGLEVKISPIRAERLVAAENGLYFINTTAKRAQYIARDGHRIETLSNVQAKDLLPHQDALWIVGADGNLYREETLFETDYQFEELCLLGDRLFARTAEGIAAITADGAELLLPSPVTGLIAGEDCLYYLDENGYPCRFDPQKMEAAILKEKTALALSYDGGKLYYLTSKGKIKKI